MSGSTAGTVTVVQPGEGEASGVGPGIGVVFKIDGQDTGGAVSIVEQPFEVGALVPPHIHTREDEVTIVLEGQVGFRSEDQEVVLGPGGYIVKPRGEVHAMWNAGKSPSIGMLRRTAKASPSDLASPRRSASSRAIMCSSSRRSDGLSLRDARGRRAPVQTKTR